MKDSYAIPNLPTTGLVCLGSAVATRAIDMIASVASAVVKSTETAARIMRVEDGALCCTDVDDTGCCSYCCYIDFKTSL